MQTQETDSEVFTGFYELQQHLVPFFFAILAAVIIIVNEICLQQGQKRYGYNLEPESGPTLLSQW